MKKSKQPKICMVASKVVEAYERNPDLIVERNKAGKMECARSFRPSEDLGITWVPGVKYRVTYEVVGRNTKAEKFHDFLFVSSPWGCRPLDEIEATAKRLLREHRGKKFDQQWLRRILEQVKQVRAFSKALPGLQKTIDAEVRRLGMKFK